LTRSLNGNVKAGDSFTVRAQVTYRGPIGGQQDTRRQEEERKGETRMENNRKEEEFPLSKALLSND
jgi:hypothetical protein